MKSTEAKIQTAIVNYLKMEHKALFCASLGGQYQPFHSQRAKAKRTGYVAGFPDLFIYESRNGYNGLALEIKAKGNYATPNQKKWIKMLNDRGYRAEICTGFTEAREVIDEYFKK